MMTLYEILYGQAPPAITTYESGTTKVNSLDQALQERNNMFSLLKSNLEAAQCRMKAQANKIELRGNLHQEIRFI